MAKIMVVIGFLVAFAAGLTVGLEARRPSIAGPVAPSGVDPTPPRTNTSGPSSRQSRSPGGWFEKELSLSPDQRAQMDKIWSNVARDGRRETDKRRDELRKERDEAIVALLGTEGKPKYDAIQQTYRDNQQALEREMRSRFEDAVKQTEEILNPEQRAKYKELLARHRPPDRDGRGSRGGPDGRGGPSGGPNGGPERSKSEHQRDDGAGATPKTPPPS